MLFSEEAYADVSALSSSQLVGLINANVYGSFCIWLRNNVARACASVARNRPVPAMGNVARLC